MDLYAKPFSIAECGVNGKVVFQLKIRPNSYGIGQETVNDTDNGGTIDKYFDNNELEFYTKENVGIVIHGLLFKAE